MNTNGMTNEEAVAYYGTLTLRPVPCGDLENLLGWGGLASRNPVSGAWEGTLVDFMSNPPAGAEALAEGLEELFSHLNKPRSISVDSNEQPWGGKLVGLCDGLIGVGLIDEALKASVLALGGGLAWPNISVEGLELEQKIEANSAKYAELYNEHLSPVINGTDEEIVAALNAMASNWSN